jgi:3-hydroxyacyl-[acyl-carrier-protein] dehydratase
MVDKVMECTHNEITAIKNVTANEPHFQGHFPGNPIMPGVMMLECLLQAGALLASNVSEIPIEDYNMAVVTMDSVRFRRRVVPGDQLTLMVKIVTQKSKVWQFEGHGKVEDDIAMEAMWTGLLYDK